MSRLLEHVAEQRREIDQKLRRLIHEAHGRGLTQAQIAASVGVSQQAVSKWLREGR